MASTAHFFLWGKREKRMGLGHYWYWCQTSCQVHIQAKACWSLGAAKNIKPWDVLVVPIKSLGFCSDPLVQCDRHESWNLSLLAAQESMWLWAPSPSSLHPLCSLRFSSGCISRGYRVSMSPQRGCIAPLTSLPAWGNLQQLLGWSHFHIIIVPDTLNMSMGQIKGRNGTALPPWEGVSHAILGSMWPTLAWCWAE